MIAWNGRNQEGEYVHDEEMTGKIETGFRFYSSLRQRLILQILTKSIGTGGAGLTLGLLQQHGVIKSYFPTHDREMHQVLNLTQP